MTPTTSPSSTPFRVATPPAGTPAASEHAIREREQHKRTLAGSFDDLVTSNLALTRSVSKLVGAVYVAIGAMVLGNTAAIVAWAFLSRR